MAAAGQTAAAPAAQAGANQLPPFRQSTTRRRIPVNSLTHTAYSQTLTREIPRTGFIANILMWVKVTVTTGTGTAAGSWAAFSDGYNPFNILKRVRLYSADGATLCDLSGQGLYLLNCALGYATQPDNAVQAISALHNANWYGSGGVYQLGATGAVAASTPYNFMFPLVIPVQMDEKSQRGLYLAQTTQSTLYLDVTTNDQSNVERGLSGLAASTVAGTIQIELDVFDVPGNVAAWPPTLVIRQLQEGFISPGATGDQSYIFQNGPIYNRILASFENNNAMAVIANIDRVVLRYGQSIYLRDETYQLHGIGNWNTSGVWIPEGSVLYNPGWEGYGERRIYDPRDRFDSRKLAQFEHRLTINSGVSLTTPKIRYVTDSMIRRARAQQ